MSAPTAVAKRISVGIGQLAVTKDPDAILIAYGLGSCIGVSIHDPSSRVVGMVHVLLPASEGKPQDPKEPARFADYGIDLLMAKIAEAGGLKSRLLVKVTGGAAVLGSANAEKFKIGERNAESVKERLKRHGLRIIAEDIGGTRGRTFELHASSGKSFVRTAASSPIEL
jgi:chemotaxis protein CheD